MSAVFKEGDLPTLVPPGLNPYRINRYHRVLIDPDGGLYIPKEPAGSGIRYDHLELGLDKAIRQMWHIQDNTAEQFKQRKQRILLSSDYNQFERERSLLIGTGIKMSEKFTDIEWLLIHSRNHAIKVMTESLGLVNELTKWDIIDPNNSQNARAVGDSIWTSYQRILITEMANATAGLATVPAKPFLPVSREIIVKAQTIPSVRQFGDATSEAWRNFIREGQAKQLLTGMQTSLAAVLREHADPSKCCQSTNKQAA